MECITVTNRYWLQRFVQNKEQYTPYTLCNNNAFFCGSTYEIAAVTIYQIQFHILTIYMPLLSNWINLKPSEQISMVSHISASNLSRYKIVCLFSSQEWSLKETWNEKRKNHRNLTRWLTKESSYYVTVSPPAEQAPIKNCTVNY